MANKKNVTISIDSNVHTEYKVECVLNSSDMSMNIEAFMKRYIEVSKKARSLKQKNHEQRQEEE